MTECSGIQTVLIVVSSMNEERVAGYLNSAVCEKGRYVLRELDPSLIASRHGRLPS